MPRRRRRRASHGSPAALVVGLLAMGGLIYGGLSAVDLRDPGDRARAISEQAARVPAGTLVGRSDVLPLAESPEELQAQVGQQLIGNDLKVQAVVPGEGFWVGGQGLKRLYVEFGGRVGENEAAKGLPRIGDRVDLVGPLRPAPKDPGRTLRLGPVDAGVIATQGAYVNADTWVEGDDPK